MPGTQRNITEKDDSSPYQLEENKSSRGEISVSQGMSGLHEHHKDDKKGPRGSATSILKEKAPYFNVDEAQTLTEEQQPLRS